MRNFSLYFCIFGHRIRISFSFFSVLCVLSPSRCTHIHTLKIYIIFHKHVRFVLLINYQSNKCVILSSAHKILPPLFCYLDEKGGSPHYFFHDSSFLSWIYFHNWSSSSASFSYIFPLYPHWMHFVQNIDALLSSTFAIVCVCVLCITLIGRYYNDDDDYNNNINIITLYIRRR